MFTIHMKQVGQLVSLLIQRLLSQGTAPYIETPAPANLSGSSLGQELIKCSEVWGSGEVISSMIHPHGIPPQALTHVFKSYAGPKRLSDQKFNVPLRGDSGCRWHYERCHH